MLDLLEILMDGVEAIVHLFIRILKYLMPDRFKALALFFLLLGFYCHLYMIKAADAQDLSLLDDTIWAFLNGWGGALEYAMIALPYLFYIIGCMIFDIPRRRAVREFHEEMNRYVDDFRPL